MDPIQNQTNPVTSPINPIPVNPIDRNILNGNNHKKVGPIITILVIVLIIVVIALFSLASKINKQVPIEISNTTSNPTSATASENQVSNPTPTVAPDVKAVTNKADDLNSLQADLNASTNGVDAQGI